MFDVFVLEPEPNMQKQLAGFTGQGSWDIKAYANGETAIRSIKEYPHLWVLDLTCPDFNSYQFFHEIKKQTPDVPVLFLADIANFEKVSQFDLQKDDFLLAPLNPRELLLRTTNLLKRHYPVSHQVLFQINLHPYIINETRREVLLGKDRVNLTSKEFNLLLLLVRHRGKVLSRDQIIHEIWGGHIRISERSVDDLVRRLRRKMTALNIETLYGYGYRLISQ